MAVKSTSRRAERKERLREEILSAASRLFSERGYENVTLRAVAEEIGYTHRVLYQYFPDKSHLLAEICQETFGLLIAEFDAISRRPLDPKKRLFATTSGMIQFMLDHPQHCRIVFFGPENRNGIRAGEYISEIGRPLFERFVSVFEECLADGGVRLRNSKLAAHAWWCSLLGLAMVLIIQGHLPEFSPPGQLIKQAMNTMWSGLLTSTDGATSKAS